ncbi:hypothetical protein L1049_005174 [Liquidambar formosana]|uniref:Cotton fiber protein n=1 Tax=Liquidambar formosana TaxID=63359 RepID=A0AAP0RUL6_LIQFO
MAKKKCDLAQRAWNILRLALLWARKGGVFRRRFMMDLSVIPKYFKSLKHTTGDSIHYGEREFSFDDTPTIHFKMHRPASLRFKMPHIPCINPQVNFDYDFEFENERRDGVYNDDEGRKSFLKYRDDEDYGCEVREEIAPCEEEGIDAKAEEFIAKFYKQMKLQRQISYLQYHEMLSRGAS